MSEISEVQKMSDRRNVGDQIESELGKSDTEGSAGAKNKMPELRNHGNVGNYNKLGHQKNVGEMSELTVQRPSSLSHLFENVGKMSEAKRPDLFECWPTTIVHRAFQL